jgi:hypothetical protein
MRRGGVPAPATEAAAGRHPLASPDDFWDIVRGTGYRATIDLLPAAARARVRDRLRERLASEAVTAVETNVVYGTARRAGAVP